VPKTKIVLFRESDGSVPVLEWLLTLPPKGQDKCRVRLGRLAELGHELRRPEADLLRDKIYELRATLQGIHFRILYFFHGTTAAVISHGIVKESTVPPNEIEKAIVRKAKFESDPVKHSYTKLQL